MNGLLNGKRIVVTGEARGLGTTLPKPAPLRARRW